MPAASDPGSPSRPGTGALGRTGPRRLRAPESDPGRTGRSPLAAIVRGRIVQGRNRKARAAAVSARGRTDPAREPGNVARGRIGRKPPRPVAGSPGRNARSRPARRARGSRAHPRTVPKAQRVRPRGLGKTVPQLRPAKGGAPGKSGPKALSRAERSRMATGRRVGAVRRAPTAAHPDRPGRRTRNSRPALQAERHRHAVPQPLVIAARDR